MCACMVVCVSTLQGFYMLLLERRLSHIRHVITSLKQQAGLTYTYYSFLAASCFTSVCNLYLLSGACKEDEKWRQTDSRQEGRTAFLHTFGRLLAAAGIASKQHFIGRQNILFSLEDGRRRALASITGMDNHLQHARGRRAVWRPDTLLALRGRQGDARARAATQLRHLFATRVWAGAQLIILSGLPAPE